MIDFKKRNKEYYGQAYKEETKAQAQGYIDSIKKIVSDSDVKKYTLGLELARFYKSKSYSCRCADKELTREYGHFLDRNANANVFFAVCEKEFGLDKSEVSRLVNVVSEFGKKPASKGLQDKYKPYKWSVLVEMLPMSEADRELITADMTIKQVRDLKKKLVATSQHKDDGIDGAEEITPEEPKPSRFEKFTRAQLIDYVEELEKQIEELRAQLETEGKEEL